MSKNLRYNLKTLSPVKFKQEISRVSYDYHQTKFDNIKKESKKSFQFQNPKVDEIRNKEKKMTNRSKLSFLSEIKNHHSFKLPKLTNNYHKFSSEPKTPQIHNNETSQKRPIVTSFLLEKLISRKMKRVT